MGKREYADTRYYIDIDMKTRKILAWDYDQRYTLAVQKPEKPFHHRIYITRGQFFKLEKKHSELSDEA